MAIVINKKIWIFGFPLDHMHKGYSEKVMAPKISNVSSNDTNKQQHNFY